MRPGETVPKLASPTPTVARAPRRERYPGAKPASMVAKLQTTTPAEASLTRSQWSPSQPNTGAITM